MKLKTKVNRDVYSTKHVDVIELSHNEEESFKTYSPMPSPEIIDVMNLPIYSYKSINTKGLSYFKVFVDILKNKQDNDYFVLESDLEQALEQEQTMYFDDRNFQEY